MSILITKDNIESSFKELIEKNSAIKPNAKEHPHQIPLYVFIKICQKYKKETFLKFSKEKHIMFPLFNREPNEKILGWLCFTQEQEKYTKLQYFAGFMPYQNQDEDETSFDRPAIIITGGHTLCEKPENQEDGFPNIRLELINSKHALAFGSNLIELNSIHKVLSEIIEINKEFEND